MKHSVNNNNNNNNNKQKAFKVVKHLPQPKMMYISGSKLIHVNTAADNQIQHESVITPRYKNLHCVKSVSYKQHSKIPHKNLI